MLTDPRYQLSEKIKERGKKKVFLKKSNALQDRKLDLKVTFPSFSNPGRGTTEMSQCG